MQVPTLAELTAQGKKPEVLFWVGCAGSFDDRAKKITKSFVKILNKAGVSFAVLGAEESCTGDPAKRAGNEFLFQMQAMANIEVMNAYEVTQIVTTCPHCFNTLKNEYNIIATSNRNNESNDFQSVFEAILENYYDVYALALEINPEELKALMKELTAIAKVLGRSISE